MTERRMYAFSGTALYVAGLSCWIRCDSQRFERSCWRTCYTGLVGAIRRPSLHYTAITCSWLLDSSVRHVAATICDATGAAASSSPNRCKACFSVVRWDRVSTCIALQNTLESRPPNFISLDWGFPPVCLLGFELLSYFFFSPKIFYVFTAQTSLWYVIIKNDKRHSCGLYYASDNTFYHQYYLFGPGVIPI